jgi:YD repeat-containing protein
VQVTVNSVSSGSSILFTVTPAPSIAGVTPGSGPHGSVVVINGANFGASPVSGSVTFNRRAAVTTTWTDTRIVTIVPDGATTGALQVSVNGVASNAVEFTIAGASTSYAYGRAVIIDYTKVPNADQADFPVLVSGTYPELSSIANSGRVQHPSGYDIIFTSDPEGIIKLDHEIESYDPTTGTVAFWVRVPRLSHTADTPIYMWYGNPELAASQENNAGVWSNGYKLVAHLPDGTSLSASDSSAAGNNCSVNSASATTGKVGGAAAMNGSAAQFLSCARKDATLDATTAFTLQAWIKPNSQTGSYASIITKGNSTSPKNGQYLLRLNGSGANPNFLAAVYSNGWQSLSSSKTVTAGEWQKLDAVWDSNKLKLYINGIQEPNTANLTGALAANTQSVVVGQNLVDGVSSYYNGAIDEVRIIPNIARSSDWLAAEYNNQSSPSAFYHLCPEQPATGLTGCRPEYVPTVLAITHDSGAVGTEVALTGTRFGDIQGASTVAYDGSPVQVVSWSENKIVVLVPPGTKSGSPRSFVVSVNGQQSSSIAFTVIPHIDSITPTTGIAGGLVTVTGTGFGPSGNGWVAFNGTNCGLVSWSDTQIVVYASWFISGPVPVTVSVGNSNSYISSNSVTYTARPPVVTDITPSGGYIGTQVTITGRDFGPGPARGDDRVVFLSDRLFSIISWTDTQIVATVPASSTGAVVVRTGGVNSNRDVAFTIPAPVIDSVSPSGGGDGTVITITGRNFAPTQNWAGIQFGNWTAATIVSWSDTRIVAIPPGGLSGTLPLTVRVGTAFSNPVNFTISGTVVSAVAPSSGRTGTQVSVTGSGFGATQGTSTLIFNNSIATSIVSWSDTQIVAVVPDSAGTGPVNVTVGEYGSNRNVVFTVPPPRVSSISPAGGPVRTQVSIKGSEFHSTQRASIVQIGGATAQVVSWSDSQIVATVPDQAITGPVLVTVNSMKSKSDVVFTVPNQTIDHISPSSAAIGGKVTLYGSGFGRSQSSTKVKFNGLAANVDSWSDGQIVARVPANVSSGPVTVEMYGIVSNPVAFTLLDTPGIVSVSPSGGPVGAVVTITGVHFGTTQDTSTVDFNGTVATPDSWSDTTIVVPVPSGAKTGPIRLHIAGLDITSATFGVEAVVTELSKPGGPVGTLITIRGSNFGSSMGDSTITFGGALATPVSWSDGEILARVPTGAMNGNIVVTVGGIPSRSSANFEVMPLLVELTDSLGRSSLYKSDVYGGKWYAKESSGAGCSSCTYRGVGQKAYDARGNMISSTDALGHTTTYSYDSNNNVISESAQLDASNAATTAYTYNSFGEVLTMTNALGQTTTNVYDTRGNLLSITTPAPDTSTPASVTHFTYDDKGQLTQIIDPLSRVTNMAYNAAGLISSITDAQQNVTSYEYDARGNRTAVVDAMQHRTAFSYDAGNRLVGITYPNSTTTTFGYDSRGRRTSVTDQNGRTTTYTYDNADRLTSIKDAAEHTTEYAYDTENNLLRITDAAGHSTSFDYDAYGRVTQTTFPSSKVETFGYDAVGNLTSKTDRKGQTISYVYDVLNRLVHKGYPDSTGVDYIYDLVGKVRQVTDPTGSYGFAYDNMGRLIGTTTQYSFLPDKTLSSTYVYDAASNRIGFTDPEGVSRTYAYNELNRLTQLQSTLGGSFGFGYDTLGRRTSLARPNGVNTSYTYDGVSRLQSVLHQIGTTAIDGAEYTLDNAGSRTGKTNRIEGSQEQYSYDAVYQLTQVLKQGNTSESYTYDQAGNRLSSFGLPTYSYNQSNHLLSTPAATYTYDDNGSMLGNMGTSSQNAQAMTF